MEPADPVVSPADTPEDDATSRPWAIDPAEPCQFGGDLQGSEGEWGAYVGETAEPEDAALIVQAVNERAALLAVGERDRADAEQFRRARDEAGLHAASVDDLIQHHRNNAALAAAFDKVTERERDRQRIARLTEAVDTLKNGPLLGILDTSRREHPDDHLALSTVIAEIQELAAVLADEEDTG